VIAVAVRKPGKGPDGRVTEKRMYKAFYGVLAEAAKWLVSQGVTHVPALLLPLGWRRRVP
jgi:transposase